MRKTLVLLLALLMTFVFASALAETAAPEEAAAVEEATAVEEAAEAEAAAAPSVIEKLMTLPWYTVAIVAALLVAGVVLALGSKKNHWKSRHVAMGAMCIAIAFLLSCLRLASMPQGGLITPAGMLPLVMFMVACGPLQGFVVGCAFGLLQLITDPYVIHPIQLLVDYPLAYGAMILGCAAYLIPSKDRGDAVWRLPLAVLLGAIGRYCMAVLSGATFFAEYAGEQNAWVYSLAYNISYLGPDTLVCMLAACIPGMSRLVKMIRGK